MNTHDTRAHTGERERLQTDRDTYACRCARAVATGDFGAAVDWTAEYETVCTKLAALADLAPTVGGER